MDLTKLIFKKEQFRFALASVTECFNDVNRYNYGCEGDCTGSCEGLCADHCIAECNGTCEGSCEGNCIEQCDGGAGY